MDPITKVFCQALDGSIAFENLPAVFGKTRDGWAGYRGGRRITKFYFSEEGARAAVEARDAAGDEWLHPTKHIYFK